MVPTPQDILVNADSDNAAEKDSKKPLKQGCDNQAHWPDVDVDVRVSKPECVDDLVKEKPPDKDVGSHGSLQNSETSDTNLGKKTKKPKTNCAFLFDDPGRIGHKFDENQVDDERNDSERQVFKNVPLCFQFDWPSVVFCLQKILEGEGL